MLYLDRFFDFLSASQGSKVTYTEVRRFLKYNPGTIFKFKSITTSWNKTIALTGDHLIYAKKSCDGKFNPV